MERVTAAPTQEDKNKILKDERLIKFLTPKQVSPPWQRARLSRFHFDGRYLISRMNLCT